VAYKTVNLRPATYERLKMYQTRGRSLSEVVEGLMDTVEPEHLFARDLEIARKRLEEMKTKDIGMTLEELDKKLARERARVDSATSRKQSETRARTRPGRAQVRRPRTSPRVEGT